MHTTALRSWNRLIGTVAVLVLLLWMAPAPAAAGLLAEGAEAPDFELRTLDGAELRLSDLRGTPVVVEFWATWCGWCRRQMPAMVEAHERYGGDVHFLMVNTDESAAAIRRFADTHPVPGTILLDPGDEVGEAYGTEVLPSLFVIDREGIVQEAVSGSLEDVAAFFDVALGDGGA